MSVANKVSHDRGRQATRALSHVHFCTRRPIILCRRNVRAHFGVRLAAAVRSDITRVLSSPKRFVHTSVKVNVLRSDHAHPVLTRRVRRFIRATTLLTANM